MHGGTVAQRWLSLNQQHFSCPLLPTLSTIVTVSADRVRSEDQNLIDEPKLVINGRTLAAVIDTFQAARTCKWNPGFFAYI